MLLEELNICARRAARRSAVSASAARAHCRETMGPLLLTQTAARGKARRVGRCARAGPGRAACAWRSSTAARARDAAAPTSGAGQIFLCVAHPHESIVHRQTKDNAHHQQTCANARRMPRTRANGGGRCADEISMASAGPLRILRAQVSDAAAGCCRILRSRVETGPKQKQP